MSEVLTDAMSSSTTDTPGSKSTDETPIIFIEPKILCKEKIVLFLDRSSQIKSLELTLTDGKKVDGFDRVKKILRTFLHIKNLITFGRGDEYYLLTESNNGKFNVTSNKTDAESVINQLKKVVVETKLSDDAHHYFQLDDILRRIFELVEPPTDPTQLNDFVDHNYPPYIVRVILIVTRSKGDVFLDFDDEIKRKLRNPYLYIDILYIHEYPSSQTNNVNEIYNKLHTLDNKRGYIFETGPNVTNWHNYAAYLLAHPFVRPPVEDLLKSKKSPTETESQQTSTGQGSNNTKEDKLVEV